MKDTEDQPEAMPRLDELETYRRLVELQSQIVELSRRNDEAERCCEVLRKRLVQQTPGQSSGRIRQALLGLLQRIRTRKVFSFQNARIGDGDETIHLTREQPCKP